jgi:hypothetical protein
MTAPEVGILEISAEKRATSEIRTGQVCAAKVRSNERRFKTTSDYEVAIVWAPFQGQVVEDKTTEVRLYLRVALTPLIPNVGSTELITMFLVCHVFVPSLKLTLVLIAIPTPFLGKSVTNTDTLRLYITAIAARPCSNAAVRFRFRMAVNIART